MSIYYNEERGELKGFNVGLTVVGIIGLVIISGMGILPIYGVWSAMKQGEAELAQANQNRQITITEAEASNVAATSKAEAMIKVATAQASAEIERAKGVAEANRIIGDSLKGNADYLRYLYITGITDKQNQIIYVPTEAGLPILEAGQR